MTSDPIGIEKGMNHLFVYVLNNPINYFDSNGLDLNSWDGFPSEDEHLNRNKNNRCPTTPPIGCKNWKYDEKKGKWRSKEGDECKYGPNNKLLLDKPTNGEQEYSYNYGGGTNPFSPPHVWKDWLPHYWYPKNYPSGQTVEVDIDDPCICEK